MDSFESEFIHLGTKFPQGLTDEDIQKHFPKLSLQDMAKVINNLSKKGMLQILKQGTSLVYKMAHQNEASILSVMDTDERVIYQYIRASDNKGIWIKDLKVKTNLHQNVLTKMLKNLESKKIVKSVKSVKNSTKKVYMLYDIEPSAEVTGGPWFSDNELDSEFIDGLIKAAFKYIYSKSFPRDSSSLFPSQYAGYASLEQVHKFIADSGIFNIELSLDDIACILDVLVYDGKVEKLTPVAQSHQMYDDAEFEVLYIAIKSQASSDPDPLIDIPCGSCPVFHSCADFGPITPSKCEYFTKWLQF